MSLITYPLNNIEYSAQDAELFHVTRTSGVYAKNSFDASVSGSDKTVVIGRGIGWIKNGEFSGKVIAQKEPVSIELGLPNSVYPRIDAIVIQFSANKNATEIVVKPGIASSKPAAPPVVRTESVYELHLYHVRRNPGVSYVTSSDITDLRLNSIYCGLMADSITKVDTEKIEEQISSLIKSLENAIADVENGSAYLQKDGSTPMTGNLNMGNNRISNLSNPAANSDAVPLSYVKKLENAYITETGTSGIWTYRKWSNGYKECWGKHSVQSYAVTSQAIQGISEFVYGAAGVSADYPSGMFKSAPMCQYSLSRLYNGDTVYSAWLYNKRAGTSTKTPAVSVNRIGSPVTATLEIYFYAIGT